MLKRRGMKRCTLYAQQAGLRNISGCAVTSAERSLDELQASKAIKIAVFWDNSRFSNKKKCCLLFLYRNLLFVLEGEWKRAINFTTTWLRNKIWMKWVMPLLFIPICPGRWTEHANLTGQCSVAFFYHLQVIGLPGKTPWRQSDVTSNDCLNGNSTIQPPSSFIVFLDLW